MCTNGEEKEPVTSRQRKVMRRCKETGRQLPEPTGISHVLILYKVVLILLFISHGSLCPFKCARFNFWLL